MFLEITEVLHADLVKINLSKGYAIIKPRQLRVEAYASYVPGKDPRVLFEGNIKCSEESRTLCKGVVKAIKARGLIEACKGVGEEDTVRCIIKLLEGWGNVYSLNKIKSHLFNHSITSSLMMWRVCLIV